MNPLIQFKTTVVSLVTTVVLGCFALSPTVHAVVPAPDGGYGLGNTAEGTDALFNLTTGATNTAIGVNALFSVQSGDQNTAVGANALKNNTASQNTAIGFQALVNNTSGGPNTATGWRALGQNTTGDFNTAVGDHAGGNITTGDFNTAVGAGAGGNITTGFDNVAVGNGAGTNVTTADDVICIGSSGENVSDSCFISNIFGQSSPSGLAVFVNSDGKLGTIMSSTRVKEDIKPMDKASEGILALQPVTFRYKKDFDPTGTAQFGLVAEEVAKVNPDLVVRDKDGKPYSVRYDQVNAMLLNEFLKEHRTVQDLKSAAAKQEAMIAQQQKQIHALTAGLQKVSAQIELSKAAPQTVLNSQ
jgi:hypothetical protein